MAAYIAIQTVNKIEAIEGCSVKTALKRLYVEEKLSYSTIANRWTINVDTLAKAIKYHGIIPRKMVKGVAPQVVERVEAIEGRSVKAALEALYVERGMSYRQLSQRWKMQHQQLVKLMKHCGIEPRKGGEAIKMQWVDNPERRLATGQKLGELARSLAAQGKHSRQGVTIATATPKVREALERFAANGATPETRAKQSESKRKLFRAYPERHVQAKVKPTKLEAATIDYCQQIGLKIIHNQPCEGFWIDVYLPELNIGIECVTLGKRPTWERHQTIASTGIQMLYVANSLIARGNIDLIGYYLSECDWRQHFDSGAAVVFGHSMVNFFTDRPTGLRLDTLGVSNDKCFRISSH